MKVSTKRVRGVRPAEVVTPHSGRMTRSLQEMGYDFSRALADVVDNSISADATSVWIEIRSDDQYAEENGPYVLIVDDGYGMGRDDLVHNMQYGSEPDTDERNLGRFGLGMKTASTSQADCLTVASRITDRNRFQVRIWDLDHLASLKDGRWVLLRGSTTDLPTCVRRFLKGKTGTAVLWTRLRPLLGKAVDDHPPGRFNGRLNRLTIDASEHLSMVFHRFLDGSAKRDRDLRIFINGRQLESWDPLLQAHPATVVLDHRSFETCDEKGDLVGFSATPAVLPRQDQFIGANGKLDREAHRKSGGPRGWAAQQGFYVYRLDRLIQGGGWSYMRSNDEHTKQARIAVDLDRSTDKAFRLNVAKTRVLFPDDVKEAIKAFSAEIVSRAKKSYESAPSEKKGSKTRSRRVAKGAKQVLTELYGCCRTASERRTLVKIIHRAFPGFESEEE
jgi:hypothetical protein